MHALRCDRDALVHAAMKLSASFDRKINEKLTSIERSLPKSVVLVKLIRLHKGIELIYLLEQVVFVLISKVVVRLLRV